MGDFIYVMSNPSFVGGYGMAGRADKGSQIFTGDIIMHNSLRTSRQRSPVTNWQ